MGIAGNAEAQNAMNAARTREVQQERQLQDTANSVFQNSIAKAGSDTAKNQANTGTNQRENAFSALSQVAQPIVGAPLPSESNPNQVVNTEGPPEGGTTSPTDQANALARARGNAWNTLTSNAAATEGGLRDWQTQQGIQNAEANRRLGVIGNEAQADAALLPVELQVASTKGDELSGWGSLVSALGSTASTAGAVGAFGAPTIGASTNLVGAPMTNLGPAVGDSTVPADAWSTLMQYAPQSYRKRYQTIF